MRATVRHYPLIIAAALCAFYVLELMPLPTPGLVACAAVAEQHLAQALNVVYTYLRGRFA